MTDATLRRELARLLETRDAHMTYEEAVADSQGFGPGPSPSAASDV